MDTQARGAIEVSAPQVPDPFEEKARRLARQIVFGHPQHSCDDICNDEPKVCLASTREDVKEIEPLLASALSEATREGLREAAKLTCWACHEGDPAIRYPSGIGPLFWHSEPSHACIAGGIWRRLEKGKGEK